MSVEHDSQDDDSTTMCLTNSHSVAVIMRFPFQRACLQAVLRGVLAIREKQRFEMIARRRVRRTHTSHKMMIAWRIIEEVSVKHDSQDDDSMKMCLSNSHESQADPEIPDYKMPMRAGNVV